MQICNVYFSGMHLYWEPSLNKQTVFAFLIAWNIKCILPSLLFVILLTRTVYKSESLEPLSAIYCIYIVALWFHCLNSFDFRASDRSCLLLGPAQRYPDEGSPKTCRGENKNLPSFLAAPENSSWRTDEEHGSMYSAVTVNKPTLQTYLCDLQIYGEKLGEAGIMPPKGK